MGLVNSNVQCYLSQKSRKRVNQKRRREKCKRKNAERHIQTLTYSFFIES